MDVGMGQLINFYSHNTSIDFFQWLKLNEFPFVIFWDPVNSLFNIFSESI